MDWRFAWIELLDNWNSEIMKFLRNYSIHLSVAEQQILQRGTIFRPGASDFQIKEAEARLNLVMSPCVRSFYELSNGLHLIGLHYFEEIEILPVGEIDWLRNQKDWIIELFQENESISDANYGDYSANPAIRYQAVSKSLILSPPELQIMLLLDTSYSVVPFEWDGLCDDLAYKFRAASLFGLLEKERDKSIQSITRKHPNFR